ncbi:hypothetical protein TIFTF001_006042 [Ficus carica]|uniref:NAD(P)-binding domain-containing protein n=1 Tax=Ficus carica TaxID=3494 RepID=A0AA88DFB0_FICCA|nr:hypothetical protein TIFTF001_006042 [Ficus carica]
MEGCRCSLHSSALTLLPSSVSRNGFPEKPFINGQVLKFPSSKKTPTATKFRFLNIRAQASGTSKFRSETAEAIPKESSKDENLAFVAGATGRVGSRAVRELLKLGYRVRAGVRSTDRAKTLVQSVKQLKLDTENAGGESQPVEKLEIVQCDLEKKEQIGSALGNASVVLCCIGASEKQSFDISGPYRIDYLATKNLIEAATVAKVDHFILLTSLGTNKVGFPAAILNLFWGVLIWKRKAEEALLASGIPYTIVRPGGMERPTDAFKETHNITLSQEDTLFGGLVSNLQVAELMACMAKNRDLSYCKVVEVIAETTAPLTPMEELLKKIPSQRPIVSSPKESSAAKAPDLAPPKSEEPVREEKTTARPLSPYTAYEDLKPPTSPSPTPSGLKKPPSDVSTAEEAPPPSSGSRNEAANIVIDGVSKNGPPQILTPYHSPYPVYDDFKPPTSPSPSAPTVKPPSPPLATESTSSTESSAQQDPTKPAPRPLSPFSMYEDLKPPASPSPSAPYISK